MAFDFSWIGPVVNAGANIYGTAKNGQITADTLNKQSELQDRAFYYGQAEAQQSTQNMIKIIVAVGAAALVAFLLISVLKRKSA